MRALSAKEAALLSAACWSSLLAFTFLQVGWARTATGLVAVFVVPGVFLVRWVSPPLPVLERATLVVASSAAVSIVAVLIASGTGPGITPVTVLGTLGTLTGLLAVAGLVRGAEPSPPAAAGAAGRVGRRTGPPRQVLLVWAAASIVVFGALGAALWISVDTERAADQPELTQLSLLPRPAVARSFDLAIRNMEGRSIDYRLEIATPRGKMSVQTLTLGPGESYSVAVTVAGPGEVVARLWGGTVEHGDHRQVRGFAS